MLCAWLTYILGCTAAVPKGSKFSICQEVLQLSCVLIRVALPSSFKDCLFVLQVLSQDIDLLHPPVELEKAKNKRKRLVQSPNSFFMDVKCQGCFQM